MDTLLNRRALGDRPFVAGELWSFSFTVFGATNEQGGSTGWRRQSYLFVAPRIYPVSFESGVTKQACSGRGDRTQRNSFIVTDSNVGWFISVRRGVHGCTKRSRTYTIRQDDSCIKWITISAEACLTLSKLWTGLVPGFFSALMLRKRVERVALLFQKRCLVRKCVEYANLVQHTEPIRPWRDERQSLPCESSESEIRWRLTSAKTTSFPVFGSALPMAELGFWATALAASAPSSLAAGIRAVVGVPVSASSSHLGLWHNNPGTQSSEIPRLERASMLSLSCDCSNTLSLTFPTSRKLPALWPSRFWLMITRTSLSAESGYSSGSFSPSSA